MEELTNNIGALILVCLAIIVLIIGVICLFSGIKKKTNLKSIGICLICGSISFTISFLITLLS